MIWMPSVSVRGRQTAVLLNSEQLFPPADLICVKSFSLCDHVLTSGAAYPTVKHHSDL